MLIPTSNPIHLPQWSLVESATEVFESDERIVCAWLSGSFGGGTADRWSDVDFRLVIGDGDFQAFVDADYALLEAVSPVIATAEPRASGDDMLRIALFEGAVRADFLYISESNATSRRGEQTHLLFDRAEIHAEIARLPVEQPQSIAEVLERVERDVAAALARHRDAVAVGSPVAAFEGHVLLLASAERLLAVLQSPGFAATTGHKHRASVLAVEEQETILSTLEPWSDPVGACSSEGLVPVLSLLSELSERRKLVLTADDRNAPGLFAEPIRSSIPAVLDLLIHASVHATYFNRGQWPGVLMGDRILLRASVDLLYAGENDDLEGPVDFLELGFADVSRESLIRCLIPLGRCAAAGLLESQSRLLGVFTQAGRAAAQRHSIPYPTNLESEVLRYLHREGAIIRS